MTTLRKTILEKFSTACSDDASTFQPAHAKELLKLALVAVRQTKRVSASVEEAAGAWQPTKWTTLSGTLAGNERFKASAGLQAMCKQIVQLLQDDSGKAKAKAQSEKSKKDAKSGGKRKAEAVTEDDGEAAEESGKKAKHKKARKAKGSS